MPQRDQSGKVASTVIGEQVTQRAVEANAVRNKRNDHYAFILHGKFFLSATAAFDLECVNDLPRLAVCSTTNRCKGETMFKMKQIGVVAALMLIAASAMASNFRG